MGCAIPEGEQGLNVARLAVGIVLEREDTRLGPRRLGAPKRPGVRPVRRDGHDGQALVEQCLQVCPAAGDEDADHLQLTPSPVSSRPITRS